MNNPYKPPKSDIHIQEKPNKIKWKFFFWIVFALKVISVVIIASDLDDPALALALELAVYSTVLIGLFGFAYGKCLFKRQLWKIVLPVGIIYDTYAIISQDWAFVSTEEMYIVLGVIAIIVFPIVFFQYMALYKYGFKSEDIWGQSI